MSIFGTLMSKIFHHGQTDAGAAAPAASVNTPAPAPASATASASAAAPVAAQSVDVEATLEGMAAKYPHEVNWRYSIVDLMAMLGMDNSLAQRKELAQELGYTGDMNDSATMNTWLHKQVMKKLAENGGKVPANLMG
ncbi:MAG: DUF3597 domain-containing protein [Gemmatimonadaceae bacterium]